MAGADWSGEPSFVVAGLAAGVLGADVAKERGVRVRGGLEARPGRAGVLPASKLKGAGPGAARY